MATTANKKVSATVVLTPEFRVSFPAVFKSRAAAEGQEPKYSLQMLFPKATDITSLKLAVKAAIEEKWGLDKAKWPKPLRLPFRDGAEKEYEGYGPDIIFVNATSKDKPGVVDQQVQPIIDTSQFYAGCYARATINAFAYDAKGNKGVAFGLRNVQLIRDGEAFSGRSKPEQDFDSIATPVAAAKASAGDDLSDLGL